MGFMRKFRGPILLILGCSFQLSQRLCLQAVVAFLPDNIDNPESFSL